MGNGNFRDTNNTRKVRAFRFSIRGGPFCGNDLRIEVEPGEPLPTGGETHNVAGRVLALVPFKDCYVANDFGPAPWHENIENIWLPGKTIIPVISDA